MFGGGGEREGGVVSDPEREECKVERNSSSGEAGHWAGWMRGVPNTASAGERFVRSQEEEQK
jgi:hypothetical protein